jgi:hypothetical protein
MPGLVKIGYTERAPHERANELSRATGVPGRFKVEKSWLIDDVQAHERKVHAAFVKHRTSGEHFRLAVATAVERINVMLRLAKVIGEDGLTTAEREKVAAEIAARQAAEARERERARQAEANLLAYKEAKKRRQAEFKEAYWPRFVVLGIAGFFGGAALAEQMSFKIMIGLISVGIAASVAHGWAEHAVTARKAREARKAEKLAAKEAKEALQKQQPQTTPETQSRFVVTYGDLYGDKSRYILFDILKRKIVFGSDDRSEVIAEAKKGTTGNRMTSTDTTNKPFMIDKRLVYEAYKAVKSNGGAAGVDGQTIEQCEADLRRPANGWMNVNVTSPHHQHSV